MEESPVESPHESSKLGVGLIFGVVLGLAFGAFIENNFLAYPLGNLVGMALGIGVGIAIGLLMNRRARKHGAESRE